MLDYIVKFVNGHTYTIYFVLQCKLNVIYAIICIRRP